MNKHLLIFSLASSLLCMQTSAMLKHEVALATKALTANKNQLFSHKELDNHAHLFSTLQKKKKKSKDPFVNKQKTNTKSLEINNKASNHLTFSSSSYGNKMIAITKKCTEKMQGLVTFSSNLQQLMKNKFKSFTELEINKTELHLENMISGSGESDKAIQESVTQFSDEKIKAETIRLNKKLSICFKHFSLTAGPSSVLLYSTQLGTLSCTFSLLMLGAATCYTLVNVSQITNYSNMLCLEKVRRESHVKGDQEVIVENDQNRLNV